jgi:hypothetical protein
MTVNGLEPQAVQLELKAAAVTYTKGVFSSGETHVSISTS